MYIKLVQQTINNIIVEFCVPLSVVRVFVKDSEFCVVSSVEDSGCNVVFILVSANIKWNILEINHFISLY